MSEDTESRDHDPAGGSALEGCADFLRDLSVAYRGDADGVVGGMRNRMIQDADDCLSWAKAIDALTSSAKPLERA